MKIIIFNRICQIFRYSTTNILYRYQYQYLKFSQMSKKLGVFDFDHTIVDDNTDIVVRKLLHSDQIPQNIKNLYKSRGWTAYMQEVFKLLHKYKIGKTAVKNAIVNISPVDAMPELIRTMVTELNFDVIIISDSNSYFIQEWLNSQSLSKYVHGVFTNPAKYNDVGLLTINMYHIQHECSLSTVNLCKGKIMEDFVKSRAKKGVEYSQIVYCGDGKNDFCPILRLKENDLACVRENYMCIDLVKSALCGKSEYTIKSDVLYWKSGQDILKKLTQDK